MIVAALIALSVQAELLVGWDEFDGNTMSTYQAADHAASGCSGSLTYSSSGSMHDWKGGSTTSTDGTYGTMGSGAGGGQGLLTFCTNNNPAYLEISFTNNTGDSLVLSNFCFDAYIRATYGSPHNYSLSIVGGDLALTNDFATGKFTIASGVAVSPYTYDFPNDIDVDLAGLPDRTLADGESVVFRLSVYDDASPRSFYTIIDNIGIFGGTIIP